MRATAIHTEESAMLFTPLLSIDDVSSELPLYRQAMGAMDTRLWRPRLFGGETNRAIPISKLAMHAGSPQLRARCYARGVTYGERAIEEHAGMLCKSAMSGNYRRSAAAIGAAL